MKKNIFANILGKFWSVLSGVLFIPLYIKFLGFESYSIISFTLLIAGITVIIDGGLTSTLSREFARKDTNYHEKLKTFKTLEIFYLLIVLITIIFSYYFSSIIAREWVNTKAYTLEEISVFIKIISFEVGFQLLLRFYIGGFLGLEKQVKANIYQILWGILRNGLVVFVIINSPNLVAFFLWQTISTFIFLLIVKFSLEKELYGIYQLNLQFKIDLSVLKRVWRFTGGMMAIITVAALNTQIDKLTISKLLSIESLGYYTLAVSLGQCILLLINPIATTVLPRFTSLYSADEKLSALKLFEKFGILISVIVFAVMANIMFFAEELIWIWTGEKELATMIYKIIPIVALSYTALSLQVLPYNIAIANGYTKINNALGILSLFITLPGYWYSITNYGLLGAASLFCIVQVVTTFLYLYLINRKFIGLNILKDIYLKQIIIPLVTSLSVTYCFSKFTFFINTNRITSLSYIGISTLFTLLVCVLVLTPISEIKKTFNLKQY